MAKLFLFDLSIIIDSNLKRKWFRIPNLQGNQSSKQKAKGTRNNERYTYTRFAPGALKSQQISSCFPAHTLDFTPRVRKQWKLKCFTLITGLPLCHHGSIHSNKSDAFSWMDLLRVVCYFFLKTVTRVCYNFWAKPVTPLNKHVATSVILILTFWNFILGL